MAIWLFYIGCSLAALLLCRLEWSFARSVWWAALTAGTKGVRRLLAKSMKQEASLRMVLAGMSLGIAALATANVLVNGASQARPNGFQLGIRLLLIGTPCVLLWKALGNRHVRISFADAALHSDEFSDELHAPYMQALWDASAIIVADMDSGLIVQASDTAERLFGYPYGALLGLNVERLVPEAQRSAHAGHRRAYAVRPHARPMHASATFSGQRMDGSTLRLQIQLVPVLGNSRVLVLASEVTPLG